MPSRQKISEAIDHLRKVGYDEKKFRSIFNPVHRGEKVLVSIESRPEVTGEELMSLKVLEDGFRSRDHQDLLLPLFGKL